MYFVKLESFKFIFELKFFYLFYYLYFNFLKKKMKFLVFLIIWERILVFVGRGVC